MCVFIEPINNTWQWIKQYLSKMVQKNRRQNQQDQGTRAKTSTDYLLSQYFQILKTVFNSDELSTSKSLYQTILHLMEGNVLASFKT